MAEAISFLLGFTVGFFIVLAGLGYRRQHGLKGQAEAPLFEPADGQTAQLPPAAPVSASAPAQAVLFEPVADKPQAGAPCWLCGKPLNVGDHNH